jgi:hypothetical protein
MVPAYSRSKNGIHFLGRLHARFHQPGDEYPLQEIARAGESFLRVEWKLERRRLPIPAIALVVVQHDYQRPADRDASARNDERLEEWEG